jgi:hypothetical protein
MSSEKSLGVQVTPMREVAVKVVVVELTVVVIQ